MLKQLTLYIISLLLCNQIALARFDANEYQIGVTSSISGGMINDKAIYYSAGRETQIYKIINAIAGINIKNTSGWETQLELVLVGDEVYSDSENTVYNDYYKNLGSDLFYYGKFPVKNAFIAYANKYGYRFKMGRMVNVYGMDSNAEFYAHRYDAPHAVYLDKELLTGVSISKSYDNLHLTGAILSGRGRPSSDNNYYLNGQTDPNTKGNNTPIIEYKTEWNIKDNLALTHSGHRNKTGSAPGELFNGKHNDERYALGLEYTSNFKPGTWASKIIPPVKLYAQIHRYVIGLTESGTQGKATPIESKDLHKDGAFVTLKVALPNQINLQVSYEHLDRMDALVWSEIAQFQPNHESFQKVERNISLKLGYQFTPGITLHGFYRKSDFDYQQLSGISSGDPINTDKLGLIFTAKLDLFF